jgi:hypothetical protein
MPAMSAAVKRFRVRHRSRELQRAMQSNLFGQASQFRHDQGSNRCCGSASRSNVALGRSTRLLKRVQSLGIAKGLIVFISRPFSGRAVWLTNSSNTSVYFE